MSLIVMQLDEAERLAEEISHSVHDATPLHVQICRAIRDAENGDVCNDVFIGATATLDSLVEFWEIKHARF